MRISDWSSDVCSSDLCERVGQPKQRLRMERGQFSCQFREHIVDRILSLGFVAVAQLDLEAADKIGTTIGVIALEAQIGREHVCTTVTTAHLVCRILLEKKNRIVTVDTCSIAMNER